MWKLDNPPNQERPLRQSRGLSVRVEIGTPGGNRTPDPLVRSYIHLASGCLSCTILAVVFVLEAVRNCPTLPQAVSERPLQQLCNKQPPRLEQSVYLIVRLTYRDGEIADARSLCPCIHCRLTKASVCKPRSSVHALFVGSILVTKHAENEVGQLAAVCGTFLDVVVEAHGTTSGVTALSY